MNIKAGKDRVIWLDLKKSDPQASKVFTVRNADAQEIWRWPAFVGNGFQGFLFTG